MSYTHGILRCPGNNIKSRRVFLNGANQLKSMSDVQNGICIAEEAVGGKTLQGEEVCTAFLQGCGKNLLWTVMGARSSKVWTSTSPNSHIHRPYSCPSFISCPETQSAVGRHSGALLCGVPRGEWALHMVHPHGKTTEVPSTSWALQTHAEGWGEDTVPPRHSTQWRALDN